MIERTLETPQEAILDSGSVSDVLKKTISARNTPDLQQQNSKMSTETSRNAATAKVSKTITQPTNKIEEELRSVWSTVLNIPENQFGTTESFFGLGGDSISAMQATSRLRTRHLKVLVQDILQHKSIAKIAKHATVLNGVQTQVHSEIFDTEFGLTPIQKMYFDRMPNGQNHFNQSFFLKIRQNVKSNRLEDAISVLLGRHSALRTQFSQNQSREWTQMIPNMRKRPFNFKHIHVHKIEEAISILQTAANSLNIRNEPLLAAVLITLGNNEQRLYIAIHHLVIDLVSWRVLLEELELLLCKRPLPAIESLSFANWTQKLEEYASTHALEPQIVLPFDVPAANFEYWGVATAGLYQDTVRSSFTVDENITALLLGDANSPLRTEPVELLMSIVLHSFQKMFPQRALPTLYSEGHGREPWSADIDISRTVGWFTTMYPICIDTGTLDSSDHEISSIMHVIRLVKDMHRRIPDKGFPYFVSRYLTAVGQKAFKSHQDMEILFNYLGLYQQLEHDEALFEQSPDVCEVVDDDSCTPRAALFEINCVVQQGRLICNFGHSAELKFQEKIHEFIKECQTSMTGTVTSLAEMKVVLPTTSDFPLLKFKDKMFDGFIQNCFTTLGITDVLDIEAIYPCSPLQEGILASQARVEGLYIAQQIWKVLPQRSATTIDCQSLVAAIDGVIQRHQALRTIFMDGLGETPYLQVVSRKMAAPLSLIQCENEEEIYSLPIERAGRLPYQFHICVIENMSVQKTVYLRLDINHALIDGTSMRNLIRDITDAYDGNLSTAAPPLYEDFIRFLQSSTDGSSLAYWCDMLQDVDPCHFPLLNQANEAGGKFQSLDFCIGEYQANQLHALCRSYNTTIANLMSSTWAILLRQYLGLNTVCFGYLSSGRDASITGVEDIIGPLITMLIRKVDFEDDDTITSLLERMHSQFSNSMQHQHCSLADIQRNLGLGGASLFNTVVNVQRRTAGSCDESSSIRFENIMGYDPSEV